MDSYGNNSKHMHVALLALDQVLKYTWSYLTILGLRQLAKDIAQCEASKTYFWVPFRVFGLM